MKAVCDSGYDYSPCFFTWNDSSSCGKFLSVGWRRATLRTRSCRGKSSSWRNATCEGIIYLVILTVLLRSFPAGPVEAPGNWTFGLYLFISGLWWNSCGGSRRWSWTDPTNRPRPGLVFWWGSKESTLVKTWKRIQSAHKQAQTQTQTNLTLFAFLIHTFWLVTVHQRMLFHR